ncbi:MAG TPA: PQQ-binding-like beta-propeller repeat protein [Gemmataceae bacterium]|nr:PQQ-binding-like beta-propeller repeat protein [Gemmataceae bacterium]
MLWLRSLLVLLVWVSFTCAADWPQWLGPTRDGASPEKVAAWKDAPKVLWQKPVGEGNSSPIVAGGRVYLHSKVKDKDEEEVLALDARDGNEVWRKTYSRGAGKFPYGNGPRATPAVSDGKLYTYGITGVLTCWDAADGKLLWQVDALKKFEAKNLLFGASCSPLVEGKAVLLNVGARGASIVAFDRDKGEVAWKSQDDVASYSSPIAFGKGKERQIVFLTGDGVIALDPADGGLFWRFPLKDALFESSTTPARAGDVLLASAITYGSAGLRLTTKDGKPAMTEAWKDPKLTSYFTTPVAVGTEHVYLVTGTTPNPFARTPAQADLHCVEAATGKSLWTRPKVGEYHASLLRTGDGKLLMLEDSGNLVLLDPGPKEYKELARSKVCGATWAHPALAGGKLYLRDAKEVICLQLDE